MTRFRLFHLKNEMLVANFLANFFSVSFVSLLMFRAEGPLMEKIWEDSIIVVGTDGVWEAHNHEGKMFGKAAFYEIIRQNAHLCAGDILNGILDALKVFQKGADVEDDITVVVIKVEGPSALAV